MSDYYFYYGATHPYEPGDIVPPGLVHYCTATDDNKPANAEAECPDCGHDHRSMAWMTRSVAAARTYAEQRYCLCGAAEDGRHRPRLFLVGAEHHEPDRNCPDDPDSRMSHRVYIQYELDWDSGLPPGTESPPDVVISATRFFHATECLTIQVGDSMDATLGPRGAHPAYDRNGVASATAMQCAWIDAADAIRWAQHPGAAPRDVWEVDLIDPEVDLNKPSGTEGEAVRARSGTFVRKLDPADFEALLAGTLDGFNP